MIYLRQSTASQEVLLGPFLDDTDGKTAETGLTIANTDIKLWKRGGTTESSKNSGGATHIASGRYYATLDATDTDTVGELLINVHVSGALPVRMVCCVLEEAVFDALFASSAAGYQVPIWSSASATVNLSGTTVKTLTDAPSDSSGTTTLLSRLSSARAGYLDNINNANLASVPTFPSNFAALVITVGGAVTAGTVSDKTGYSITGTTTTLDALQAALNSAHGAGSWATATGFSTHSAADVWAVGTRTITGGTITTYTGNTPQTGDAYAAIAALSIPTVAAIADGVWDEAMNEHTTDGTYGGRIVRATNNNVTVQITNSHHVAANVHELQAGVIESGAFATDAIAAACVSAGAANKIADHVRRRTQGNVEASSDGDTLSLGSLYGFIQQAQESSVSGGTLFVKKTDGSTTLGTKTVTSSASADPITGIE